MSGLRTMAQVLSLFSRRRAKVRRLAHGVACVLESNSAVWTASFCSTSLLA